MIFDLLDVFWMAAASLPVIGVLAARRAERWRRARRAVETWSVRVGEDEVMMARDPERAAIDRWAREHGYAWHWGALTGKAGLTGPDRFDDDRTADGQVNYAAVAARRAERRELRQAHAALSDYRSTCWSVDGRRIEFSQPVTKRMADELADPKGSRFEHGELVEFTVLDGCTCIPGNNEWIACVTFATGGCPVH